MNYREAVEQYVPRDDQERSDRSVMLEYIARFPENILTRENRFAHFTASALVVNGAGDKVLMAHHNIYQTWAWPGGHADGESDLLPVALREAREETGIQTLRPLSEAPASLEILPVWGHVKRGAYVSAHQHLNLSYLFAADEGEPLRPCPGENTRVAWLPADRLLHFTQEPQMDFVYRKLLERVGETFRQNAAE